MYDAYFHRSMNICLCVAYLYQCNILTISRCSQLISASIKGKVNSSPRQYVLGSHEGSWWPVLKPGLI